MKLGKFCPVLVKQSDAELLAPSTSSKYQHSGEGRNAALLEGRHALGDWFIYMKGVLTAGDFYCLNNLLLSQKTEGKVPKRDESVVFSNKWIKHWMKLKESKREVCKVRLKFSET